MCIRGRVCVRLAVFWGQFKVCCDTCCAVLWCAGMRVSWPAGYAVFKAVLGGLWCLVAVLVVANCNWFESTSGPHVATYCCVQQLVCACDSLAPCPHVAAVCFAVCRGRLVSNVEDTCVSCRQSACMPACCWLLWPMLLSAAAGALI